MKLKYFFLLSCMMFLLAGCTSFSPHLEKEPVENVKHLTMGHNFEVENTDDRLILVEDNSTLAADGLYYASWGTGKTRPYENSDGDTIDLYDASLYLLTGEAKTQDAAENYINTWLEAANENYEISEQKELSCNGQSYTVILYSCTNKDNPYARGISAFGTFGNNAVCAELTCLKDFDGDLEDILTGFLNNCSYTIDN